VLHVFRDMHAEAVDPVNLPNWQKATGDHVGVMFSEFEAGINRYLSGLTNTEIRTLADVVTFNGAHHAEELRWHNQGLLEGQVDSPPLPNPDYLHVLRSERLAQADFDELMHRERLDAIVAPTFLTSWRIDLFGSDPLENGNGIAGPYNAAGYPNLTVPAGFAGELPVGLSFLGRPWQEPKLLRLAYAFEQAIQARRAPRFIEGYGVRAFVKR
jgi:amidase